MKQSLPRFTGQRHTARTLSLQVLLESLNRNAFVQELLDGALAHFPLSAADRRLATQLVYGVLRRRGTLDALLRSVVARQPHQVEPSLWEILRLGSYQLALLTQVPPHAAVHETVDLAGQFGRPQARGFINGVLRSVQSLLGDKLLPAPAADALPLEAGRYRMLARPVLPDPAADPAAYLAAAFSLPRWLVRRWLDRWGWEECLRVGFWFAGQPPLWLRCNRLKVERTVFLDALARAGFAAESGTSPQVVRLIDSAPIRDLPGYSEGWFSVQDYSAVQVGHALRPTPGSRVLDLCAAPGGKTTHLAELMDNQGEIVACDVKPDRLRTVEELCRRLGITIVQTFLVSQGFPGSRSQLPRTHAAQLDAEVPRSPAFDFILVDVPCSNTGVLGRRPEARWRLRPEDFAHLVPLQTKLLIEAAERIRAGGTIVYSTCSIEVDENQQVVQNVLRAIPDLILEEEQLQVPGKPADGGYWARLRRKES
jgi:16S rRNA (cytosine967-C5)-methyltransferase